MPHLEPTYLRFIYDGLIKGSIHPENAAELPDGLIGLYEEAFDERTSVIQRQKLLKRFVIWALLKKEVSAAFVAEVMGETEDDIQEFISTYSAWFNSPESGKYQLYHERLKVYLLQKLSDQEIHMLHEKLISRLEQAIEEQKADEFEWYGLEFLTGHLGVSAMLNGDGKKLIEHAYSLTNWQRQLKISKGYTWTKNGLKEVMSWASKYNDDEVIECGLQMVDLHQQEQNAAPQIVALVAEGDFDAALKRIEQFGGNDKEGLERKFILYMLCLMELTLLESKDKPYRKEGIEKLLKHLDEHLPVDHSMLNWNDFFPSYLMFELSLEWESIKIDDTAIYSRTDEWDTIPIFDGKFIESLKLPKYYTLVKKLPNSLDERHRSLLIMSINFSIHNLISESNEAYFETCTSLREKNILSNDYSNAEIQDKIVRIGKQKIFNLFKTPDELYNSISQAKKNPNNSIVNRILVESSFQELIVQKEKRKENKFPSSSTHRRQVIKVSNSKSIETSEKSFNKIQHALQLTRNGDLANALDVVNTISSSRKLFSVVHRDIANELLIKNQVNVINEVYFNYIGKSDDSYSNRYYQSSTQLDITAKFIDNGRFQEGLFVLSLISNPVHKGIALTKLSSAMNPNEEWADSDFISDQSLISILKGTRQLTRFSNSPFNYIISELTKKGNDKRAITIAKSLINNALRDSALSHIVLALLEKNNIKESISLVLEIENMKYRVWSTCKIAKNLLSVNNLNLADELISSEIRKIDDSTVESDCIYCYKIISEYYYDQNKYFESDSLLNMALSRAQKIKSQTEKYNELIKISKILYAREKLKDTHKLIEEILLTINESMNERMKSKILSKILIELIHQRKIHLAESIYRRINWKNECYTSFFEFGKREFAANGYLNGIELCNRLEFKQFITWAKSGLYQSLNTFSINKKIAVHALKDPDKIIPNIVHILKHYALNQLFFEEIPEEKIQRFNRALNLQWAIDIKNQLPN